MCKDDHQTLRCFLKTWPPFGGWEDSWLGVPLAHRVGLTNCIPPLSVVASVRGVVLHDNHVLLVRAKENILNVGGRLEEGETLLDALHREIGEESGWLVSPLSVIGYVHSQHLDEQRPAWRRPAPEFMDVIYAVEGIKYEKRLHDTNEIPCEMIPINEIDNYRVNEINLALLREALRKRVD